MKAALYSRKRITIRRERSHTNGSDRELSYSQAALAKPKCDRVEGAPILLQSEFAFGTAVNVIKDYFRNAAAGQRPQIADVHHGEKPLRAHSRSFGHLPLQHCLTATSIPHRR